ncbi:MAG: lipopolysaccharide heptosyltransferase I [Pyrinomonadaceae bacterium MAG19_C2-C3]|nr:lipopolysaccharide heptosyltransferase I [Pyrinomonadaceae bacterium MAG19_C2-C3]
MHILIVKLGSIGDIVHTLPAVAAMREGLPGARIAWAVERRAAEILRGSIVIDDLIELDTKSLRRVESALRGDWSWTTQLKSLRRARFDVALDFQGLWKSAAVAFLSGAERRYGFAADALREPASRVLMTRTFDVPPETHIIRKNLTLAREALGIAVSMDERTWSFPITPEAKHEAEAAHVVSQVGHNFIILNPGGNWWTKRWSAERFGKLADELWRTHNLPSVITHSPDEHALAERVVAASDMGAAHAHAVTLKGFFALARKAQVYVGGDTGPTHLAVAAGAPVVGLFGPTEWWRNGSPRRDDIVVERTDISCRANCHRRACDRWVCMDMEVARVARAVAGRLRAREIETAFTRKEAATNEAATSATFGAGV